MRSGDRRTASPTNAPRSSERRRPDTERTIVFTGMGSSYDACYPAVTALAAAGVPALHIDASELLHFRRNLLPRAGLLVTVSQSGESAEVVRLIEGLARTDGAPLVVAVTNGSNNTLARLADVVLDTRAGDEVGPSTMTFAAALVALAAVGRVLRGEAAAAAIVEVRASGTLGRRRARGPARAAGPPRRPRDLARSIARARSSSAAALPAPRPRWARSR